ncbi:MAG: bifunctional phosphopantothenoylcysteine decarboxylase/phosphopantothenate--cysteine ligase CoaBC [Chitinophagales bacterium]|nr:bifunctional phosphopantothenoylcysteine decarboxylase/phosphopantothenate--cysteine ligase CoaBC [Chitinophagales bacterium]
MLFGKKILLGITGSIAAYKSAFLIRLLIQEEAVVKVLMTRDANSFISPLTLATLSKNKVLSELTDNAGTSWNNHVELGLWADVLIIAPASANTIAKFANGLCDNLLTTVYLSARCPVIIVPAMDEDMWKHASTQKNLAQLKSYGNQIIPVGTGELASGLTGEGRMAEPQQIINFLSDYLEPIYLKTKKKLSGKKALVTAGPTYEAIDPVRFIGNRSSGKMGIAIAEALAKEGAEVELITGPTALSTSKYNIQTTRITSTAEMHDAVIRAFENADITIMAAAVADFTPEYPSVKKIKKQNGTSFNLPLVETTDIINALGKRKRPDQLLVGFALESNNEITNATEKLKNKNLDFIVLNSLNDYGAGFELDTNKIMIIDRDEKQYTFEVKPKSEVAKDIVDFIVQKLII